MKAIVLERGATERSLIQSSLESTHHALIFAESPEDAVRLIKAGQGRFIIADEDSLGRAPSEFVHLLRGPDLPSTYVLILTAGSKELIDADDVLDKPFEVTELTTRILVAQRFLSLADSLSRAQQQIESMALYDDLTGLLNRGAFSRTAQAELERARRALAPLSLIVLDIHNFDALKGTLGVGTANELLRLAAQTIKEKCRPYDCVGRWTGAQFVIALPNVIGEDAKRIAERIIRAMCAEAYSAGGQAVTVSASAGISSLLRINTATEVEPLIQQAQQAMLRASEAGGNEVNLTYA